MDAPTEYRANFLWPFEPASIEEAGYEFANARTEVYRKIWWGLLVTRIRIDEAAKAVALVEAKVKESS